METVTDGDWSWMGTPVCTLCTLHHTWAGQGWGGGQRRGSKEELGLQWVGHCLCPREKVSCGKYWSCSELAGLLGPLCVNKQAGPGQV